ncbi:MAG: DUF2711 family protein [Candidatus Omnitrophica bacterium]|nr:DUF2711 family protein [Candidatus Omnitrophota bacterium]
MTKRVAPEPDKYASCPHDGKILEYYRGQFDSVYILLHPFLRPLSIDFDLSCPEKCPSKHEIIEGCEPVSWRQVLNLTGLSSLSDIDVGLRTSIGALKEESANEKFASCLDKLTEEKGIIHPTEGGLPPLLENRIFNALKKLGYEWLWVGNEWGTERKLHWVDDLIENKEIPCHGCGFTPDYRLLVATHWDSHCSLLCSSKENIDKILEVDNFEGFFCTEKTEIYWSLHEI